MFNFKVLKPCANCPFRMDIPRQRHWLGKARATEIANAILYEDKTFTCHKTIDSKHQSHCAGALILIKRYEPKENEPNYFGNSLVQIAERLGLYEPDKLDESIHCFTDKQEFIDFHSEE